MIKQNQKYLNILQLVLDTIIVCASFALAHKFRESAFFTHFIELNGFFPAIKVYAERLYKVIPIYPIAYSVCSLYTPMRIQGRRDILFNLVKANIVGIIGVVLTLYFLGPSTQNIGKYISRVFLGIFFIFNTVLTFIVREFINQQLRKYRSTGHNLKHTIVVGFSTAAAAYMDRLARNPQWGYSIHGIFDDNVASDFEYRGAGWLGTTKDLAEYLAIHQLDEVAVSLPLKEYDKLENLVRICEKSGVHTKFVPDYNFISSKPYTEDLMGLPVINIRHVPLTNTVNKIIKRIIDIIGAIVAIILFSPFMLIAAIAVKLSSPGPIIFKQIRVGLGNKQFEMYKFRSMGVQPHSKEKSEWTTSNDPRVTTVGKFIRRTSIDELPQFFNVLKGDMSLIGPRPERPYFVEKFKEEIPRYMIKHQVRPGITGWAQVNGFRGDTSIRGRIDHDLYYIENWTLGLDFKILFLTFFKGFVNKNAY